MDGNLDARCGSRRGFGFGGGGSCGAMGTKSQKPTELNWPVSSKPIKAPPHPRPVFCFFRASSGVCVCVLGIGHWPLGGDSSPFLFLCFVLCALCTRFFFFFFLLALGAWRLGGVPQRNRRGASQMLGVGLETALLELERERAASSEPDALPGASGGGEQGPATHRGRRGPG
jgi:hypothetical protein